MRHSALCLGPSSVIQKVGPVHTCPELDMGVWYVLSDRTARIAGLSYGLLKA